MLPRALSSVELCCVVGVGIGSLPALGSEGRAGCTHTAPASRLTVEGEGGTQEQSPQPLSRVGKSRVSWEPLELHVEGDIRGHGICFSSLSTCFSFCCCHKVCSHPHHSCLT